MILQALDMYYDRLAQAGDGEIPLVGFGRQKIHYCLVIDREGKLALDPQNLCVQKGSKRIGKDMIVPAAVLGRTGTKIVANFLWDNTGYVLGSDEKGKPERAIDAFEAFKAFQHSVGDGLDDDGMRAVLKFLDAWSPSYAAALRDWEEMAGRNVVFRLAGDQDYVHARPKVREVWLRYGGSKAEGEAKMCLVAGNTAPIARLHPAIKGVMGAQSSGAALVSFNLEAFKSYGKDQNFNAPIGEKAAFAYTTALNWLLRGESRQKIRIGDSTVVFWAERKTDMEELFADMLAPEDDENQTESEDTASVQAIRVVLEAACDGRIQDAVAEPEVEFFILGLSPNASRLSVRFWLQSTVGKIVHCIGLHLRQIQIAKYYPKDPTFFCPPLWKLLRETATLGKSENVSPLLAGALTRAVLTGERYPPNLLSALLIRIRADKTINRPRAALIKALLMRNHNREITMSLDKDNTNIGYRLGRLFAVLEMTQESANKGINSTIRDKYFGSASATPRNIFPMLLSLSQKHLGKIRRDDEKKGKYVFLDKNIAEIVAGLDAEPLPAFLDPVNQGMFAIGYYHQRRDFFTKNDEKE